MSSAFGAVDSEEKSLIETLKTILRLSKGLISLSLVYGNTRSEVLSLALALLEHGYNPISLSNDLWTNLTDEIGKVEELSEILSPVGAPFRRVLAVRTIVPQPPLNWDGAAGRFRQSKLLMSVLENWTRQIFSYMMAPMMAKGRTPTPSEGGSTARRKQWSLKRLLIRRDGWISLVGKMMDESAPPEVKPIRRGYAGVTLQAAHIVPFGASGNSILRIMLSKNMGQDMEGLLTGENINDASNALLLDSLTHAAFGLFKFSIECQDGRYYFRRLAPTRKLHTFLLRHRDGEEITFGQASGEVALPSSLLCNLHYTIGRVLWTSGAAENIAKALADEDELKDGHMEGDYWHRVSVSYLQRELIALSGLDELATEGQDDSSTPDKTIPIRIDALREG
ncbi:hypothetical protein V1520DRAFT_156556 [Lipomyces starkeyi]|uniref:HNH nuclease domain-containing protein n=1 Tax=Lipomyces starkeyi NRRL Y-11557 TaxID=675824 RepID=A0A1E3PZX0_LIPST|nr:hypothetical protein LIPSTDRAFT_29676 [Lipomyces starkeyi NRRL Y-11557]